MGELPAIAGKGLPARAGEGLLAPFVSFFTGVMAMDSIKSYAKPLLTVLIALAVIHYVAPASIKTHLGVS